ncbi:hypothetical protein D9M69_451980 [compost metagenome]
MYLSSLRKHGAGPGNWGPDVWWGDNDPDHLLDMADDTLNSWVEAHAVFDIWQGNETRVELDAFDRMKHLVHRVIGPYICNTPSSYPNEAVTYALLQRWIRERQEQLRIDQQERKACAS